MALLSILLFALLHYSAANVAAGLNEIEAGISTGSCQALEYLLLYTSRQDRLESDLEELRNRTDALDKQCCTGQTAVSMAVTIQQLQSALNQLSEKLNGPRDCMELLATGHNTSGVYTIYPDGEGKSPVHVYCDMDTDGGGWTMFQKRQDGSVNFYQDWRSYKTGFGDLRGEFWLGNNHLHRLTAQDVYELRVDLEDFEGNTAFAKYNIFRVEDEVHKYRLTISGYSGTAGDAMTDPAMSHNGMYFSTRDRENDPHPDDHCAVVYTGAWWYNHCHRANLNGLYLGGAHQSFADGVIWEDWKGFYYSLKTTEMKIRPN